MNRPLLAIPVHGASPMDPPDLQQWVGREESVDDTVSLGAARRMAAMLDRDPGGLKTGSRVPAHWFAMVCTPFVAQSGLGDNGHAADDGFMPPVTLGRRNLGGRRVRFYQPLCIGQAIVRTSRITSIVQKTGRAGRMCIVTVSNDYLQDDRGLTVTDEQDLIFSEGLARPGVPEIAATAGQDGKQGDQQEGRRITASTSFLPDSRLLFRFSALTFNAFRVHYDLPYASGIEHLDGLIVNGSLATLKIWDFVTADLGIAIKSSRSRNLRPLLAGKPVVIEVTEPAGGVCVAHARDSLGRVAVQAELSLA